MEKSNVEIENSAWYYLRYCTECKKIYNPTIRPAIMICENCGNEIEYSDKIVLRKETHTILLPQNKFQKLFNIKKQEQSIVFVGRTEFDQEIINNQIND